MSEEQEGLIRKVAEVQPNLIVILNGGGGVDMRRWIDAVRGLIVAFYPGQEGGQAIAEVILGDCNPSGKLPITIERNPEDRSSFECYHAPDEQKRVRLTDGLLVGYRHFDRYGIEPLFPFGFGLSYTQFLFENIELSSSQIDEDDSIEVTFDVTNAGARPGTEVAQLYIRDLNAGLDRPEKELKAFSKVFLDPGERKQVRIQLDRSALEHYDVAQDSFAVHPGQFEALVGCDSKHISLRAAFSVGRSD
jgi:beta-glucosidase